MTSRCQSGFTLLELVAAMAIVAVLFLVLSGSLSKISSSSVNVRCVNHLRQSGGALVRFAADHNGRIPGRAFVEDGESMEWHRVLIRKGYVEATIRPRGSSGSRSSPIFYCPGFTPVGPQESIHAFRRYGMRVWAPPGKSFDDTRLLPLTSIREPANFFLLADSYYTGDRSQGYQIMPGSAAWRVHLRHGGGTANALFADGRVAAKDASYFERLHETESDYNGDYGARPFTIQRD